MMEFFDQLGKTLMNNDALANVSGFINLIVVVASVWYAIKTKLKLVNDPEKKELKELVLDLIEEVKDLKEINGVAWIDSNLPIETRRYIVNKLRKVDREAQEETLIEKVSEPITEIVDKGQEIYDRLKRTKGEAYEETIRN